MSSIQKVAVIGGSGNLGRAIVDELLAAGFSVTALSRASSTATFPDAVAVAKVDHGSLEALTAALQGQDAVVSVVATVAVGQQQILVDAAVAAKVKRFIPSEFGINTRIVQGKPIGKILAGKVATVDYLQEKAKENPWFTWTGLCTGFFFDWGLNANTLGIDIANKKATIVDSGNEQWQASNLAHIGKAVAAVLRNPDKTANQYLSTASFNVSQAEIVRIVEELTGTKLAVEKIDSKQLQQLGEEKLAKGDYSAFVQLVRVWMYGDGSGHALKKGQGADELLGVPEDDLRETVRAWLVRTGAL